MRCVSIVAGLALAGAVVPALAAPKPKPAPTPPPKKAGSVLLRVDEGSTLVVDGQVRGPLVADQVYVIALEQGRRELRVVTADGEAAWSEPIELGPAQVARIVQLGPEAATVRQDYMKIPAGSYERGCIDGDAACAEDEKPRHAVTLSRDFWMRRTEVTVREYRAFAEATGRSVPEAPEWNDQWKWELYPMVNMTWDDAAAYCTWAAARLPTEAEWEYAARGGIPGRLYVWGNDAKPEIGVWQQGNVCDQRPTFDCEEGERFPGYDDGYSYTTPVYHYLTLTGYRGLFEMGGNALEWVADWYGPYGTGPEKDPSGPASGETRVLRGGSFKYGITGMRVSNRYTLPPQERRDDVGIRCVREVVVP